MVILEGSLWRRNGYEEFNKPNSIEKNAYLLGSELWEYDFEDLLSLVKEYDVDVWDAHKQYCCGDDSCPSQLHPWLRICS